MHCFAYYKVVYSLLKDFQKCEYKTENTDCPFQETPDSDLKRRSSQSTSVLNCCPVFYVLVLGKPILGLC